MTRTGNILRCFRAKVAPFIADEAGAVLPMVTVLLVVLIGFATLAVDLSRLLDLQTQLQKAADAFALAGAAELDGSPDAITRADAAIDTLMNGQNKSIWGGGAVTVASRTYHATLPATDDTAMGGGGAAAGDARYVEVTVAPVTINTFLPAMLFGAATNTMTTSATAVAGFTQALCKTTPMFICNPYEGQNPGIYDEANIGKMFVLKTGPGGTDAYSAGNYGFLSVDGSGAKVLKDALAANDSGACFWQEGVTTEPGDIASASDALNVRFDIYEGSAKSYKDADHPPAPNVRKGCLPDKGTAADTCGQDYDKVDSKYCQNGNQEPYNSAAADLAKGLPPDASYDTSTGLGNGVWDLTQYWSINHNGTTPPEFSTRYDAYAYEIDNNLLGDYSAAATSPPPADRSPGIFDANAAQAVKGESGAPNCNKNPGGKDRRIIYVAVIDCTSVGLKGGKNTGVRVKAFAKFFLLKPVTKTDQTIYGEFLGLAEPGADDGVLHDIVQLYR